MKSKRKSKQVKKDVKETYLTFRCTKQFKNEVIKIAKKYKLKTSQILESCMRKAILEFNKITK